MSYTTNYASGANIEDTGLPPQLFAGDTPQVVTQDFPFDPTTAIGQFVPLTLVGDQFVPWTVGDYVDAVSAYPIPLGESRAAVYTAGMFNIDALQWPEGTTEAEAMAAMRNNVKYRKLLYSGARTGGESAEVGPGNEAGQAVITLSPTTMPSGDTATPYSQTASASGGTGPYTFSVASGALPAGLSLNASTGAVTGTPSAAGSYNFTLRATDSLGSAGSRSYSVAIASA